MQEHPLETAVDTDAGNQGDTGVDGDSKPFGQISVLIADDDKHVRETLAVYLSSPRYKVNVVADGDEAIAFLKENIVDIVVTDLIMPHKEGIETIFEIRKLYPHCPIIAISGGGRSGRTDFLTMAEKLGASVTLRKPFRKAAFEDAINRALAA